jgi:UDP-N-acetyl-D-glucosamine dehydrogenase
LSEERTVDAAWSSVGAAARALAERIDRRDYTIAVMGLGYVGLPLALTACDVGFKVLGIDVDHSRVADLSRGRGVGGPAGDAALRRALESGRFGLATGHGGLADADAIIITVPTPLTRNREPDLSHVVDATKAITRHLRPGHLIVLESTTWPGTTLEVVKPRLEATGLVSGRDFFLAFSPEREDPGNGRYTVSNIPKVVGGDGGDALALAGHLYGAMVAQTVPVSSPSTAEAVKLTENIFRAVNVALVNELKVIFHKMDIDVWEVIEAAKTKPFGYMPFYPGPGLGGHCIPIDPFYLTWKAREYDVTTRFIELAGQINKAMPAYVVDQLAEALDRAAGRGLRGARVLVIGVAYKKNVGDVRESPALRLIELLEARGASVSFHDPHVAEIPAMPEHPTLARRASVALAEDAVAGADVVLIATDHDAVDFARLAAQARLVVDTRNACAGAGVTDPHIVKA